MQDRLQASVASAKASVTACGQARLHASAGRQPRIRKYSFPVFRVIGF